jgi:hypothetical protein
VFKDPGIMDLDRGKKKGGKTTSSVLLFEEERRSTRGPRRMRHGCKQKECCGSAVWWLGSECRRSDCTKAAGMAQLDVHPDGVACMEEDRMSFSTWVYEFRWKEESRWPKKKRKRKVHLAMGHPGLLTQRKAQRKDPNCMLQGTTFSSHLVPIVPT